MCETSNSAAAARQCWCSAMMPAGYCTGIAQPAKSTMLAAELDVQIVQRRAARGGADGGTVGSLKAETSAGHAAGRRAAAAEPPLSRT